MSKYNRDYVACSPADDSEIPRPIGTISFKVPDGLCCDRNGNTLNGVEINIPCFNAEIIPKETARELGPELTEMLAYKFSREIGASLFMKQLLANK